jgi:DNA invertase Pin-like site-specific DNA recombinase
VIVSSDGARLVGYARVSTEGQELALQLDALRNHGVANELIFTDKASGAKRDRPGLDACFKVLRPGDILLVWRLDRLGRSLRHLVTLIDELRERGVGFRSVCDGEIDTTTPSGELIFHIFSSLAHFERRLIQERTKAGLVAARARGRTGGRPKLSLNDPKVVLAKKLFADESVNLEDICVTLKISKTTLYRYVALGTGCAVRSKNRGCRCLSRARDR